MRCVTPKRNLEGIMTVHEKAELIIKDIKSENGTNPVHIFKKIARKEYISIHGPEHHILDGASLLVAYKNAGGNIDIDNALEKLMSEGFRMPGAMCGIVGYLWCNYFNWCCTINY